MGIVNKTQSLVKSHHVWNKIAKRIFCWTQFSVQRYGTSFQHKAGTVKQGRTFCRSCTAVL